MTTPYLSVVRMYDECVRIAQDHYEVALDGGDIETANLLEQHMHAIMALRHECEQQLTPYRAPSS